MTTFLTTTGYASTVVRVSYEIEDGNVYDMEVTDEGRDVQKYMSLDAINDIEMECHANERKLALIEKVNAANDKLADLFKEAA